MMQSPFANLPSITKNLLIINIICFLPFLVFSGAQTEQLYNLMSAHYFDSPLFKPWQPLTYMFFHGGWMHIIFNMFALYSFGSILENSMGPKRFISFYFICGLGGIALQMLVQAIEVHGILGTFTTPDIEATFNRIPYADAKKLAGIYFSSMVGASGAIYGLLLAFAMMYPNAELMIMFIPVPVKAKYIMPAYILLELFLGIQQFGGDNIAHFAHLGGVVLGFILVKAWRLQSPGNYRY
ncbi:rhomboid family intramembrane serine protease [Mucilaginibacter antarcticus]|uniref:Rhomboid family intramembrane serine protease n=1 Tax=Mucilaginibacter antarcticus TaxID=1855725 RepID=A0ABW5XRR9_9SPHI